MEYQPKYVMLNTNNSTGLRAPPQRRNIPRYQSSNHSSGGKSCLKCLCCCFCFWFLLIFLLSGLGFYLYTAMKPQMPTYNVDGFEVIAFNLHPDYSLYTEFAVIVKASNPNERISFIYGQDSLAVVSYSGSSLCSGVLPAFHQPKQNTTMIRVVLKGNNPFGSGLQQALMDNRNTGRIPLLVTVKAPVSVLLQSFPLREVVVYLNCSLVVDNLSPNKQARVLSATYNYRVGLS